MSKENSENATKKRKSSSSSKVDSAAGESFGGFKFVLAFNINGDKENERIKGAINNAVLSMPNEVVLDEYKSIFVKWHLSAKPLHFLTKYVFDRSTVDDYEYILNNFVIANMALHLGKGDSIDVNISIIEL